MRQAIERVSDMDKDQTREHYEALRDEALREWMAEREQRRVELLRLASHQDAVNRLARENGDKVLPYPGVVEMAGCGDVWGEGR